MTDTAAADRASVEFIVNSLHSLFPSFDYRSIVEFLCMFFPFHYLYEHLGNRIIMLAPSINPRGLLKNSWKYL